ncbi:E3 ubiquitin-protein ligase SIAH1B [Cephus cinctus]|uniref:E3 ubiquitin-protein ligase SIAH1B n=1 Tax=Cephus cinctus TaxID=211228 RepID=A0AAJ7FJS6_CEPCN|nr:E3 ubiquitin-protein ligase SIAH1B [Cephus cinctus]XP_015595230.1 E3 ubiquitin-protein ligase SIAH1B [Cephus cinctus]
MVEEIRLKWCEDLEELLQCPVCYERPVGTIYQCIRGHHICNFCRTQMDDCPLCKSSFSLTRSFLAEALSSKLDDIKLSLINPMDAINKKPTVKQFCDVATGTEPIPLDVKKPELPKAGKGIFPCRVGFCLAELPHGRMIPHVRYFHEDKLYELSSPDGETYTQDWQINYLKKSDFDIALRIKEMGLFFLNIVFDDYGDLCGCLQIVNSSSIGKQFEYKLEVEGRRRNSSFTGSVPSCRSSSKKIYDDCLHVNSTDMLRMISDDGLFSCKLSITRDCQPDAKCLYWYKST